jgi:hypothetical protein
MSTFEDLLEVHYNAETRIEGLRHIDTLRQGLDEIAAPSEDVTIVLDWGTLAYIAGGLDVEPEVTGHVPREHVELRPEKIELALDSDALVFGQESGTAWGVLLDSHAVRLDNSIANHDKVVAIDFTDA